jgi:DNA-binding beta-propeller fold protein YncE
MKHHRIGFGTLLTCLGIAALLVGVPLVPAMAQGLAFVPNFSGGDITVIDASQSPAAVVNTISDRNGPEWVAITPSGHLALVTNGGPANPDTIAVIFTARAVNSTSQGASAELINAEKLPSCATGRPCRNPAGIAVNPVPDASGNIYAYVSNPATSPTDTASVTVINIGAAVSDPTLSNTASATNKCGTRCTAYTLSLPVGRRPQQLSVSPDGTKLWVTDLSGFIYVIDTGQAITSPSTAVETLAEPFPFFGVAPLTGSMPG